jgi:hypothetical protein
MRREPGLTFEGALLILGQHEHKTIEKIDKLLGGLILGGGVVAGLTGLGAAPAAAAAFGVVWTWAEQRGLAVELLTSAVDAVTGKVSRLRGLEKRELIAAAHSTIVVASVFEALREHVDEEFYTRHGIGSEATKARIVAETAGLPSAADMTQFLYGSSIPAPSAATGFEENSEGVGRWQWQLIDHLRHFLEGDASYKTAFIDKAAINRSAVKRYRSQYAELAAKVPEFAIWAQLNEHAATRAAIGGLGGDAEAEFTWVRAVISKLDNSVDDLRAAVRESNAEVMAALGADRNALNRVAALLSAGTGGRADGSGLAAGAYPASTGVSTPRGAVASANSGILAEAIVPADPRRYPAGLRIPLVSEIYVNPRYRAAAYYHDAQPASERWWADREQRDDFDVLFTAHVTSADATRLPLLLLGHPGAGKSLLTKVLAARLPQADYTVVRVPLRRVTADAWIHRQVEEALEISTQRRIEWPELAAQSADTVRVVLLDGLDELLQASEHDRSRYLEDVVEFQERAAEQRLPVVVVVTSRTVVADRVRIPEGTTIVKLDPFSVDDVAHWAARWNQVNGDAITAGKVGALTASNAGRQRELAEQPLLLLMLALYAADRTLPPLDQVSATGDLYQRLLEAFARREAAKELGLGHDPSPGQLDRHADDHLERLTVAALGMFNRGRQDIREAELGKDIDALAPEQARGTQPGQRIIGEFFFVHVPEAVAGHRATREPPQRAYEFLHATFAEYLDR